jgi:hypothetical protein
MAAVALRYFYLMSGLALLKGETSARVLFSGHCSAIA